MALMASDRKLGCRGVRTSAKGVLQLCLFICVYQGGMSSSWIDPHSVRWWWKVEAAYERVC